MLRVENRSVLLSEEEYNRMMRIVNTSLSPIEAEAAAYVFRLAKLRDMKPEYIRPFRSALGKLEARYDI